MTFNGTTRDYVTVLGKVLPYWVPRNRMTEVTRSGIARIRRTEKEVPIIPVDILVDGENRDDFQQNAEDLAAWLVTDETEILEFSTHPGRRYLAAINGGVDPRGTVSFSQTRVEFVVIDILGEDRQIPVPTSFATAVITGQEKTPWNSRTKFSASASSYTLETNKGGRIELKYSFVAGDVLEIDYEKRKITLNGKNIQTALQIVPTRWFMLEPGAVQMKASHETTVEYTERFY